MRINKFMLGVCASAMLFLCVAALPPGVVGKLIHQYPQNPSPPTSFMILEDPGDGNYQQSTIAQILGGGQVFTNFIIQVITNNTFINTNVIIATSNAFFNNTYVSNITVAVPGGLTNLNWTAKSAVWVDQNQALQTLPNGAGVFTNDAAGNIGWSASFSLAELDALNAYLTNIFTLITNSPIVATDGNGKLIASSYKYSTNIVGAANFVFGKAYWTNITGNWTFPPLTMQDQSAMETLTVWATNSGASVFTATIPGVAGAPGHVIPAVFNCTNATVTRIDVAHFGVLWTNAVVGAN